jgi:hypothetical protein
MLHQSTRGLINDLHRVEYQAPECHLMAWATASAVRWRGVFVAEFDDVG